MRRRALLAGALGGVAVSIGGYRAVDRIRGGEESTPYRPLGRVPLADAKEAVVDGGVAYAAVADGIATVDVSDPADPTVLAEQRGLLADRPGGPMEQLWDVAIDGDRLLVAGPANPVGGDAIQGLLLYDVSEPAAPRRVAFHETDFPIHNATIRDGRAYLTGNDRDREPLVIVDVREDGPEEVGRWSLLDHDTGWGDVDPRLRWLHDVHVRNDLAFLALWDAGTWFVDVSDPSDPTAVGNVGGRSIDELASIPSSAVQDETIALPGNHHYATSNEAGTVLGTNEEAWAANATGDGGPGGIDLWDVRDPSAPTHLATIDPPPTPDPTYSVSPLAAGSGGARTDPVLPHTKCHECGAIGDGVWTTSHNFQLAGDRLFTSWYQGGVKIHDIGDPADPTELAWWRRPDETSFWTAQLADESTVVASSMGWDGDGMGAIYTFPNRPGEQDDPPSLAAADRAE
ncbi:LVIVD repeat-containing protein [Halovivax limisalsi]|uniref:LVIVD repeat-containing protein n=1 Tax=Halovivax limisalsi TaxID=1453760 RepID=UPI001FFC6F7E|nr:hypothetical protein [Halovivax limisalsi]